MDVKENFLSEKRKPKRFHLWRVVKNKKVVKKAIFTELLI